MENFSTYAILSEVHLCACTLKQTPASCRPAPSPYSLYLGEHQTCNASSWVQYLLKFCLVFNIYRQQRSFEGYVFTRVCHSVHGGGGSASVHAGIPPPSRSRPLRSRRPRSRPPLGADPPGADTPPGADPLGADTPPPSRHPCRNRPPQADTPPEQTPLPRRLLLRTVRILFECILVLTNLTNLTNSLTRN